MQNVKGTYDYFGKEQRVRRFVQSTLREVFEAYDYDEMESASLNELELLASKYAGGEEILKEMYQLTDQGKRSLGLRYDLTIPFAKVMALNPGITLPFRRYEIGKVFRDGPVKRGRLREFLQCDVDVVGIQGPEAEAELMQLAIEGFRRLDIPIVIRWNNRQFLGEILEAMGVPEDKKLTVMLTLDKMDKIGKDEVAKELLSKGLDSAVSRSILRWVEENPTFEQMVENPILRNGTGTKEVLSLQQYVSALEIGDICRFDPFLSRGLSFYTGTVYEIFDASGQFRSSLGGGGRYDKIIGQLVDREEINYPTVGLSFGMESIMAMIRERELENCRPDVVVIPIGGAIADSLKVSALLRNEGIRTRLDTRGRKLKKSIASLAAEGIPYLVLIGEEEAALGQVRLKDLKRNREEIVTVQDCIWRLKIKE